MTRSKIYWGALPATAIDGLLAFAYKSCLSKAREAISVNPLSDRMFLTSGFEFGEIYRNGLVFWPLEEEKKMNPYDGVRRLSEVEFLVDGNDECWVTALVLEVQDFDLPGSKFRFQKERLKMRMRNVGDASVIVEDVVEFSRQLAIFALLYADLAAWAKRFQTSKKTVLDMSGWNR